MAGTAVTSSAGDDLLVVAARDGDRAAFGALYEKYRRMVHGLLFARVPYGEVDDMVQDVFVSALRNLRSVRDPRAFGGWLATIARNRARDYHRGAPGLDELPENLPGAHAPDREAWGVLEAVRSLPEAYRETLVLRWVEGMTGPEIAERTGLKPESVRVNLHRGMKQLREKLGTVART
jgi:RNA polymerase sigma-70 factor (ECF subfamily)